MLNNLQQSKRDEGNALIFEEKFQLYLGDLNDPQNKQQKFVCVLTVANGYFMNYNDITIKYSYYFIDDEADFKIQKYFSQVFHDFDRVIQTTNFIRLLGFLVLLLFNCIFNYEQEGNVILISIQLCEDQKASDKAKCRFLECVGIFRIKIMIDSLNYTKTIFTFFAKFDNFLEFIIVWNFNQFCINFGSIFGFLHKALALSLDSRLR
ncbi:unnamed protein product [Paramecium sonneborni]|uniref:Transmembrane protein n=1 Tax=Paramecium sonneborni TaxID=65129 RepID=A0A8S1QA91_9CILI|nr:unnamed protein product [Paramecium sonneborni]